VAQVVGEIVAGLLLGPSVLGRIWPGAKLFLFPKELLPHLDVLSQVGLIFYMFLVGLEHARRADLVVLGLGDEWARNKESLGGLREAVAARTPVPTILVRRHGQRSRLRRAREWIDEGAGGEVLNGSNGERQRRAKAG
jgi:hypothetical protein